MQDRAGVRGWLHEVCAPHEGHVGEVLSVISQNLGVGREHKSPLTLALGVTPLSRLHRPPGNRDSRSWEASQASHAGIAVVVVARDVAATGASAGVGVRRRGHTAQGG